MTNREPTIYCKICGAEAKRMTPAGEVFCERHWRERRRFLTELWKLMKGA